LEDALKVPATGPIGLEADRGQMEYRRIRVLGPPQAPGAFRVVPTPATNLITVK
jgi:hypothetical protein